MRIYPWFSWYLLAPICYLPHPLVLSCISTVTIQRVKMLDRRCLETKFLNFEVKWVEVIMMWQWVVRSNIWQISCISQIEQHSPFWPMHPLRNGWQGFIQRGGAWNFPPPPEILKLSMVINVLSELLKNNNLVPDCIRSNLRRSKFKIFLGEHAPRSP